jgi:hypothetical protein
VPGAVSKANDAQYWANSAWDKAKAALEDVADKMPYSIPTGSYTWNFNKNDGIVMYSGNADEANEVFRVGQKNGVSGLWMKGGIVALYGMIGPWTLTDKELFYKEDTFKLNASKNKLGEGFVFTVAPKLISQWGNAQVQNTKQIGSISAIKKSTLLNYSNSKAKIQVTGTVKTTTILLSG